jgi:hypothetical protein
VRVVVAVAHDGKAGNIFTHPCDEYVNVGSANTRCDALRCPAPSETVFNQIAR